jgi:hypothetical protein
MRQQKHDPFSDRIVERATQRLCSTTAATAVGVAFSYTTPTEAATMTSSTMTVERTATLFARDDVGRRCVL